MQTQTTSSPIESLLAGAEQYHKTTLELLKLKSVDKTSDVASTIISRAVLAMVLSFFTITLTTACSFWLGDLLGKTYYGFLIVASVYGALGIILFLCHPMMKKRLANAIILQMLN
jgi:hypothetical protein